MVAVVPRLRLVVLPPRERQNLVAEARHEGTPVIDRADVASVAGAAGAVVFLYLLARLAVLRQAGTTVVLDDAFRGLPPSVAKDLVVRLARSPVGARFLYVSSSPEPLGWFAPVADQVDVEIRGEPDAKERPGLVVVSVALAAVSFLLWTGTVGATNLRAMGDLGLAPVLPVGVLAALGVLSISFCALLFSGRIHPIVAALHVVLLVVMLFGTTIPVQEVPRFHVSWRHAGIAEHLIRTANLDRTIDAYFNWPGFFVLVGMVSDIAGFSHPLRLATWAPVYFNLLFLLPVFVVARWLTPDPRLHWAALWFFLLGNWVGQDYLAPQALALGGYIVVVAAVLTQLDPQRWPALLERRVGALLLVVAVFLAMVSSHQLTPFAVVAGLTGLVILGRCGARTLPLVLSVALVSWIVLMTEPFLAGRIRELVEAIGDIATNATANVGQRVQGSPEHLFVVRSRLLLAGLVWGLAGAGFFRRYQRGGRALPLAALVAAPLPLFVLQPYGGEMLLRVFLLGLPFAAVLAGAAFFPTIHFRLTGARAASLAVLFLFMTGAFLFARYGNERIDQFTREEVRAIERLYEIAPRGSLLIAQTGNLPWRAEHYAAYDYRTMRMIAEDEGSETPKVEDLLQRVEAHQSCAYVIFTRSDRGFGELLALWEPAAIARFEEQLRQSPSFDRIFRNDQAEIFVVNDSGEGERRSARSRCPSHHGRPA